jgi:spermidine/putrescine transport system permease protein
VRGPASGRGEWAATAPSLIWLALFFLLPTLLVFAVAFRPADPYGGIAPGWTLDSWRALGNASYPAIAWRTLWISALSAVLCVAISVPVAWQMARAPLRWRRPLLLLVVVPFWTSFLVRVFAWRIILHPEGVLRRLLAGSGLIPPDASLLYNAPAVLLITVYSFIPFAILPVYAAAERFDFQLLEAARDLGAGRATAVRRVFLPGIGRGIRNAALLVFIPALGSYVVPDLVGGTASEMVATKIAQRAFTDRHLPHAAALAALLTLVVLLPLLLALWFRTGREERGPGAAGATPA